MPRITYKPIEGDPFSGKEIPMHDPRPKTQVVDRHGRPQKLSSYQKNALYRQAKNIQGDIRERYLSKNDCWKVNDRNVQKMERAEKPLSNKVTYMKKCMKAIGADPSDYNPERYRRNR